MFRKEIPKQKLESLETKILDYLEKNGLDRNKYKASMDRVSGLYVENLVEQCGTKMIQRSFKNGSIKEIALDKQFVEFDEASNPKRFKKGMIKLINSQLGHELIHAASTYDRCSGIQISNKENEGLNEGLTQAITEDIFGYTVSPVTDGYNDLKKYAKILMQTFGNKDCLNSYFGHTNDLKNRCNNLSGDANYYKDINSMLSMMFSKAIPNKKTDFVSEELNQEIYKEASFLTMEKMCIKTIIPHMKTLPEEKQKDYIEKILLSVKDDQEFYDKISSMITTLGTATPEVLNRVNKRNENQFKRLEDKKKLILDVYYDADKIKDIIQTSKDGKVFLKNNPKVEIVNPALKTKIFSRLFEETAPDNVKQEVDRIIDKNLSKDSGTIRMGKLPTNRKMQVLSRIKERAYNKGCILMLDSSKLDEDIEYDVIKLPQNGKLLNFQDLRRTYEKYKIEEDKDKYSNTNMFIEDRKTGEKIEGGAIYDIAMFANLWASAAGVRFNPEEQRFDMDYAFGKNAQNLYEEMMNSIKESLNNTGMINTANISAQIASNGYKHSSKVVDRIFGNKGRINIINKFIKRIDKSVGLEVEIPENSQNFRGLQDDDIIKYDTSDIMKMIGRNRNSTIKEQIDKFKELMREPENKSLLEVK